MASYQCPKCNRYGVVWDGRAKVLMCHYNTCNHVIRIENQISFPTPERILEAIANEHRRLESTTPPNVIPAR